MVQGSFQVLEAFCEGEVERQGLHCEHPSGSYEVPRVMTHPLFVACFAPASWGVMFKVSKDFEILKCFQNFSKTKSVRNKVHKLARIGQLYDS